ncbi:MAG: hypothetical protein KY461_09925 [Actinobacteria bacterium]|nr:hypothetical protein [Actinomycetota bacterium]
MTRSRLATAALLGALAAACSSTGEPGHTSAIDVVPVDAAGVSQTVVPATDGFDRVTVTTATFGRDGGVDGVLTLTVTGAGEERTAAAAGGDIPDNGPVTLAFPPVAGSAGRPFTLGFRYQGAHPLALYRNPFDPYADGELRPAGGDLVFSLGHADRVGGAVSALGRSAREAATTAGRDPVFLSVWVLALLAVAGAGVRLRAADRSAGRDAASRR